jgi:hypothetical protein
MNGSRAAITGARIHGYNGRLTVYNADLDTYFDFRYGEVALDSARIKAAGDIRGNVTVRNCAIVGHHASTPSDLGVLMFRIGERAVVSRCTFDALLVSFGSFDSLTMSGNVFRPMSWIQGDDRDGYRTVWGGGVELWETGSATITNNNFWKVYQNYRMDGSTMTDNIVEELKMLVPAYDPVDPYSPTWRNNLFMVLPSTDHVDLWYNMVGDPLFADSTRTVVQTSSPAIGAGSAGGNIGYYQGLGVSARPHRVRAAAECRPILQVHRRGQRYICSLSRQAGSARRVNVYDSRGARVWTTRLGPGETLEVPVELWPRGVYFVRVHAFSPGATQAIWVDR